MQTNDVVKPNPEKAKTVVKEVECKGSNELYGFQVEAPALNSTIEMQIALPSIVVVNPFTDEKVTIGQRKIEKSEFLNRVRSIIDKHNLTHSKDQQIKLSDEAINAIYGLITFVDYRVGETIKVEFPIPARWFRMDSGRFGFKWRNKLGSGLFIIADEPKFEMVEFDRSLLGLKASQFTYMTGEYRKDKYGAPIFIVKADGKHWLIKNIIKGSEPQLNTIVSKYYKFGEDRRKKDGREIVDRNEYAVIDAIRSNDKIRVEKVVKPQHITVPVTEPDDDSIQVLGSQYLPEPPKEVIFDPEKQATAEAAVDALLEGKKKKTTGASKKTKK